MNKKYIKPSIRNLDNLSFTSGSCFSGSGEKTIVGPCLSGGDALTNCVSGSNVLEPRICTSGGIAGYSCISGANAG